MRTRPRFDPWSVRVVVHFPPSILDGATLTELAQVAGDMVGLGDHRPRFGWFDIEPTG